MELMHYVISLMPAFISLFWVAVLVLGVIDARDTLRHRLSEQVLMGRRRLALYMGTATLIFTCHALHYDAAGEGALFIRIFYATCNLATFPLFLIYIGTLAGECAGVRTLFQWRWMGLLLPAAVRLVLAVVLTLTVSDELSSKLYAVIIPLDKVAFVAVWLICFVRCLRIMQRHDRAIANYYADVEGRSMKPFRVLLQLMIIGMVITLVCMLLGSHFFVRHRWLLAVLSMVYSILYFLTGFEGMKWNIRNLEVAEEERLESLSEPETLAVPEHQELVADNETSPVASNQLFDRAVDVLRQQHLYLQPNLKITDLTRLLGTNRTYLYQAINVERGLSFSELVNRLRVEHAVQLMRRSPEALLDEVAVQSGFSSSASFYRNFRQFQGCSPREFLQRLAN
jgi:AraC-like DNA-binding protein